MDNFVQNQLDLVGCLVSNGEVIGASGLVVCITDGVDGWDASALGRRVASGPRAVCELQSVAGRDHARACVVGRGVEWHCQMFVPDVAWIDVVC